MSELEERLKKQKITYDLCYELDQLYFYALKLIPIETTHTLGFRKEKLKGNIETKIMKL